ncbi:MAG: hypothetical protein GF421_01440 [Candidatus Aminicenantes bacterium]|nr:hypothetical protein [Candidatus Aminicenantes bacterium]
MSPQIRWSFPFTRYPAAVRTGHGFPAQLPVDIQLWMFFGAGGITLIIALLTVIYQSIKAVLQKIQSSH